MKFRIKVSAEDSLLVDNITNNKQDKFLWQDDASRLNLRNPIVDVLSYMNIGDHVKVSMSSDSLKGNKYGLVSGEFLHYEVILDEIKDAAAVAKEKQELEAKRALVQAEEANIASSVAGYLKDYKRNKLKIQKLDTGLEIYVVEEGTGAKPNTGESINVHYYGVLTEDGTMFDNSYKRGEPISFPLGRGQVIQGWEQGLAALNKGSKAVLFIPAELGYGAAGSPPVIPANAKLAFYVDLQK